MEGVGIVVEVLAGERDGEGGDVDAVDVDVGVGDCRVQEGVEEEGDATCAGAEVEDVDGWGEGRVGEEGLGEVGG